MDDSLFEKLKESSGKEGPFMDHGVDRSLLPALLEWIGSDWERLRIVLNYVHERGEQVGLELARKNLADLLGSVDHRVVGTWEYRLRNPEWYLEK